MVDIGGLLEQHLGPIAARTHRIEQKIQAQEEHRERLRSKKLMKMPLVTGQAVSSALAMGTTGQNPPQGPDMGYAWSVRLLVVEGLATGATPDIVNVVRSDGRIVWQLNGNQFAQTFGRGEMPLFQGEFLTYVSVGTFTSTARIIAHGMAENIAGELMGEFF